VNALEIEALTVSFGGARPAVFNVALRIAEGVTMALLGESGSGKTTIGRAVLGVLPRSAHTTGRVLVCGHDMLAANERARRAVRGRTVAYVPQDTGASLNPVVAVIDQVAEVFRVHERASRSFARGRAAEVLEDLGVAPEVAERRLLPDELSGGMRQRCLIAIALALEPRLIVADEPTSALDPETTLSVLEALARARRASNAAVLLVTHDLGVAATIADEVTVLREGVIVDAGRAGTLLRTPTHPYTRALVAAAPRLPGAAPAGSEDDRD